MAKSHLARGKGIEEGRVWLSSSKISKSNNDPCIPQLTTPQQQINRRSLVPRPAPLLQAAQNAQSPGKGSLLSLVQACGSSWPSESTVASTWSSPPSTPEQLPPWVPLQPNSFWVLPIARVDQGRSRKQGSATPLACRKDGPGAGLCPGDHGAARLCFRLLQLVTCALLWG